MTREHKLALIIGFALVLTVGMLVSDHFSTARGARLAPVEGSQDAVQTIAASNSDASAPAGSQQRISTTLSAPLLDRPLPDPAPPVAQRSQEQARLVRAPASSSDGVDLASLARAAAGQSRTPASFVPAAQSAEAPFSAPAAATRRHQVQPDDTLWSICAREYNDGSLHERLAAYNAERLGPGGVLRIGATILLPPVEMLTGAPPAALRDPVSTPRTQTPPEFYIVRKGDTLGEIAQRMLGSAKRMRDIIRVNSGAIDDENDIKAGMRLRLPSR